MTDPHSEKQTDSICPAGIHAMIEAARDLDLPRQLDLRIDPCPVTGLPVTRPRRIGLPGIDPTRGILTGARTALQSRRQHPWQEEGAYRAMSLVAALSKHARWNRAVEINNWLLPLNPFPDLSMQQIGDASRHHLDRNPDRPVVIRSLVSAIHRDQLVFLDALGYRLVQSGFAVIIGSDVLASVHETSDTLAVLVDEEFIFDRDRFRMAHFARDMFTSPNGFCVESLVAQLISLLSTRGTLRLLALKDARGELLAFCAIAATDDTAHVCLSGGNLTQGGGILLRAMADIFPKTDIVFPWDGTDSRGLLSLGETFPVHTAILDMGQRPGRRLLNRAAVFATRALAGSIINATPPPAVHRHHACHADHKSG